MHCQAGQWQSFGKYDIFTVIYAGNESKSVLARNLEECRDNDKNSQSVFLSFKCILARNCEGTEQLRCRKGLYAEKGESYAEYFLW